MTDGSNVNHYHETKMTAICKILWAFYCCLFAITCAASEETKKSETEVEVLAPLPEHWQKMKIQEPIFGGSVHVVEVGTKHKPTIVLVHGLGYSGLRDWLDVIPHLEADYHVVALDLPGFGESDPTSIQLAPVRYAQLLKWLIPQFSKEKVIIMGHSMGGAISLRFASEYPHMLKRLIMVDTAGVLHRSVFVRHMTKMPDRYEWIAKYQQRFNFIDSAVGKVNRFLNRVSGTVLNQLDKLPDPTLVLMRNEFAQKYVYKDRPTLNAAIGLINEDFSQAIHKFAIPTHIIWGEQDRVAPLRTGELLQFRLNDAELHVIKDAGHVPMKDKTSEFLLALNQALQRLPINTPVLKRPTTQLRDLVCQGQNDQVYSGHYANVYIRDCKYITLKDISADGILIERSEVTMQNINVASDTVALDINSSFSTITNAILQGQTGLQVQDSTVDMAGATLITSQQSINVLKDSLLYLSVSQVKQGGKNEFLHGMSQGDRFNIK